MIQLAAPVSLSRQAVKRGEDSNTMVGIFCSTCTVTGYPRFYINPNHSCTLSRESNLAIIISHEASIFYPSLEIGGPVTWITPKTEKKPLDQPRQDRNSS